MCWKFKAMFSISLFWSLEVSDEDSPVIFVCKRTLLMSMFSVTAAPLGLLGVVLIVPSTGNDGG